MLSFAYTGGRFQTTAKNDSALFNPSKIQYLNCNRIKGNIQVVTENKSGIAEENDVDIFPE